MGKSSSNKFDLAMRVLRQHGLLLQSDVVLPSVASIVAGAPVRGSWWGHPAGLAIFRVTRKLASHPDLLQSRLLSRKVTWVHKSFWPPLLAVGLGHERWQTKGISAVGRRLLEMVAREGRLRTDQVSVKMRLKERLVGAAARELEERVLVHAKEFHTERGAHAKRIQTWQSWAEDVRLPLGGMTAEQGRVRLEGAVESMTREFRARPSLPWDEAT